MLESKKKLFLIYIIFIISYLSASSHMENNDTTKSIHLTQKEKLFLKKHTVIKKCVDPYWMPLEEINQQGIHVGVIADILQLIEEKIGIKTQLVVTENWAESIKKLNARECDIVTSDTLDHVNPLAIKTEVFIVDKNVYITRADTPFQLDFASIMHRRIGIPIGYPTIEVINEKYGKVNFVEVKSVDEGLLMVSRGELYAFTDLLPVASYSIQKQLLTNLKVAGHLDISVPITMSVRSDMPELATIFNKALGAIDKTTINNLYGKWIKLEYDVSIDWKMLIIYVLLSLLILAFVLYWVGKLHGLNCKLKKANEQLELLNETDTLSKMKNRNFILHKLPILMKHAHKNKDVLNIAIMDIDKFKHLNDTYGHDIGDKCIIAISNKVHTIFNGKNDWNIRYGGDEFVIISFGMERVLFNDKLHLLKDEIEQLVIDDHKHIPCSISIGYTFHSVCPKVWHEKLVAQADRKLYEAKESGRNRIFGE